MAKRRRSEEERVVRYFQDEPVEAAEAVYHIVQGVMARRQVLEEPLAQHLVGRQRKRLAKLETPAVEAE